MITLEQIKQLETRVHSAVARIRSLTVENTTLKNSLSDYESRIDELENLVNAFKSEQGEIEAGIIAALAQLDGLEDAVTASAPVPLPDQRMEPDSSPADVHTTKSSVDAKHHGEAGSDVPGNEQPDRDSDGKRPTSNPDNKTKDSRIGKDAAEEGDAQDTVDVKSNLSATSGAVEPDEEEPELDIF